MHWEVHKLGSGKIIEEGGRRFILILFNFLSILRFWAGHINVGQLPLTFLWREHLLVETVCNVKLANSFTLWTCYGGLTFNIWRSLLQEMGKELLWSCSSSRKWMTERPRMSTSVSGLIYSRLEFYLFIHYLFFILSRTKIVKHKIVREGRELCLDYTNCECKAVKSNFHWTW